MNPQKKQIVIVKEIEEVFIKRLNKDIASSGYSHAWNDYMNDVQAEEVGTFKK